MNCAKCQSYEVCESCIQKLEHSCSICGIDPRFHDAVVCKDLDSVAKQIVENFSKVRVG